MLRIDTRRPLISVNPPDVLEENPLSAGIQLIVGNTQSGPCARYPGCTELTHFATMGNHLRDAGNRHQARAQDQSAYLAHHHGEILLVSMGMASAMISPITELIWPRMAE